MAHFLNNFSVYRELKKNFIKNRNKIFDNIFSVQKMTEIANKQVSLSDKYFYFINPDFDSSIRFMDQIDKLKIRLKVIKNSNQDDSLKKQELRKIINKAIRMRKFVNY